MAPITDLPLLSRDTASRPIKASLSLDTNILEAWAEGFNFGALIILILIVFCNYRRGIILHKLILLELFFALFHGTFIFCQDPTYGWYLSSTALLLFISYQLHNVVSWVKIKPFLPRWGYLTFIITLIAVQPFWVVETWDNFAYFNNLGNDANIKTRPWEALFRDPWWIFTTCRLVWIIKRDYNYTLWGLIRTSPRFGIMLFCMFLSIAFLLADIIVTAANLAKDSGINPYWRLALVFKCASDTIFLDDFKSVLDTIVETALARAGGGHGSGSRTRRKSSSGGVFDHGRKESSAGSSGVPAASAAPASGKTEMRFKPSTVTTISVDRERAPSAQGRPLEWNTTVLQQAAKHNQRLPKLQIQAETTMLREVEGARSADGSHRASGGASGGGGGGPASRSGSESSATRVGSRATHASADSHERLLPANAAGGRRGRKLSVDQWGDVIGESDEELDPRRRGPTARSSSDEDLPPPPVPAKLAGQPPRVELP